MRVHNYLEEIVERLTDNYADRTPDFCGCEQCKADVAAMVLTKLQPAYASTTVGHAIRSVTVEQPGVQAKAMVEIVQAAEKIAANPHH